MSWLFSTTWLIKLKHEYFANQTKLVFCGEDQMRCSLTSSWASLSIRVVFPLQASMNSLWSIIPSEFVSISANMMSVFTQSEDLWPSTLQTAVTTLQRMVMVISYKLSDIWYLISDIWYLISNIWYLIYDIWYLASYAEQSYLLISSCSIVPLPSISYTEKAHLSFWSGDPEEVM